ILITFRIRAAHPTMYRSPGPGSSVRASRWVTMPMTGRSFEIASSTSFTDFLRQRSIGMIEPGKSTEFRSGRIEMISGTSTGPSGAAFLDAIARSYTGARHLARRANARTARASSAQVQPRLVPGPIQGGELRDVQDGQRVATLTVGAGQRPFDVRSRVGKRPGGSHPATPRSRDGTRTSVRPPG